MQSISNKYPLFFFTILNCCEKAKLFNDFSKQCNPIINSSVPLNLLIDKENSIDISIQCGEITLIQNLNHIKATGSDGISGQMLLL